MNLSNFLIDYFNPTDEVEVNAVEFQKLVMESRQHEMNLAKALKREIKLNNKIECLQQTIQLLEFKKTIKVDLLA